MLPVVFQQRHEAKRYSKKMKRLQKKNKKKKKKKTKSIPQLRAYMLLIPKRDISSLN